MGILTAACSQQVVDAFGIPPLAGYHIYAFTIFADQFKVLMDVQYWGAVDDDIVPRQYRAGLDSAQRVLDLLGVTNTRITRLKFVFNTKEAATIELEQYIDTDEMNLSVRPGPWESV